jgi:hypothetical protein
MFVRFLRIIDLVRWNPLLQFYHVGGGPFVCRVYAGFSLLRWKRRQDGRIHLPVRHGGGEQSRRVTSRD